MDDYARTLLKVIDTESPVDPDQLMGRVSLFNEDGTPFEFGGGGGGVPDPPTIESLVPFAGPGVVDYVVSNPTTDFDHPGYFKHGGEVFLQGVWDTTAQSSDLIMTLPEEVCPRKRRTLLVRIFGAVDFVNIEPNGEVKAAGGGPLDDFCVLMGSYLR